MSAAVSAPKRVVLLGSVWRRQDPSGAWILFEVIAFQRNPFGQNGARGKTLRGRPMVCDLSAMENGDPRFEHVHDDRVRKTGA